MSKTTEKSPRQAAQEADAKLLDELEEARAAFLAKVDELKGKAITQSLGTELFSIRTQLEGPIAKCVERGRNALSATA